jgi:dCTP deaminase
MYVNGKTLLAAAPIEDMIPEKRRFEGTSYGLAEAGYDIRIKQRVEFYFIAGIPYVKTYDPETKEMTNGKGRFTLASAIEKFQMPGRLVGKVADKSTWARRGLSVFNTIIEPKWVGYLTLELVYHGNEGMVIEPGQGIAQVLFGSLTEEGDYGDGKYQGQSNRPHAARS